MWSRPLPFSDPGSLVHVWSTHAQTGAERLRSSLPDVEAWAGAQSVEGVAAFNYTEEDLTGDDAKTAQVSPSKEELAACDKGVDTAACASLIGGELPSACTSGSDW